MKKDKIMTEYYINASHKKNRINKEIYGHFSEHLGRCIYEGIYVGEHSDIPNVNGMRKDVVDALERSRFLSFAGQAAALQTSITGWTESGQRSSAKR